MPRPRDPKRDEAFELWRVYDGEIKLKDIAKRLGLSDSQVRKWKSVDDWDGQMKGNVTKPKGSVTKSKGNVTKQDKKAREPKERPTIEPVIENDNLTDKQKEFCLQYLKYFNATKAYQKAYGVNQRTADANAYRLMGNDGVREEIERLKAERQKSTFLDSTMVLQKYIDIAFADISDFTEFGTELITRTRMKGADEEGNPIYETYETKVSYLKFKDDFEVDGTLITEVKMGKDGIAVKLADKMKALEMLAKHTDMLDERTMARLKQEQMRMNTLKTEKEIDHVGKGNDERPINIVIGRKGGR